MHLLDVELFLSVKVHLSLILLVLVSYLLVLLPFLADVRVKPCMRPVLEQLLFSGAIRAAVIPNRDQRVKTSFGTLLALLFSVPLVRSLLVPL